MSEKVSVVLFDQYGAFELRDPSLVAEVPADLLTSVGGGGLDGFCKSNAVCNNTTDVACINSVCHPNVNDVGCVGNAGCV